MHSMRRNLFAASVLLLVGGCNFSVSTAHINGVKIGKDKAMTQEATAFAPTDTIYVASDIGNSSSKTSVKGRLLVEDVAGQQVGPIPGLETTVELPSSGTATFDFSAPTSGWPVGKYKVEVLMMNDAGVQKDQKTVPFTVAGS